MAYNQENLFKKIIEIQDLVLEKQKENEDLYYKEIFYKYIEPKYFISYRTFNSYMSINAKRELKKMQEKKQNNLNNKNETSL